AGRPPVHRQGRLHADPRRWRPIQSALQRPLRAAVGRRLLAIGPLTRTRFRAGAKLTARPVSTRCVRAYHPAATALARAEREMGVPLPGYQTSRLLRSSGYSRVYEAIRESDGRAVVAKVFDLEGDDVET